jgi:uncharacterized membrane protein YeaQ/YmgE (transglycosylase-associated protein family)
MSNSDGITVNTNSLSRFAELVFVDFFGAAIVGFIAFQIFNGGAEQASLAAYMVGLAGALISFKFLRKWELVKKTHKVVSG